MLKLIKFTISGHSLFAPNTTFSLQAVSQNNAQTAERVINFGQSLYLNRTIGVVGINATGKSTLFKLFEGLSAFYLNDRSIEQTALQTSLRGVGPITVQAYFANQEGTRYQVTTVFAKEALINEELLPSAPNWIVRDEVIYKKQLTGHGQRKNQFTFHQQDLLRRRSELAPAVLAMLSPKDSAFRAELHHETIAPVISLVPLVDFNRLLTFNHQTPTELLQYLDSAIEYLHGTRDAHNELTSVQLKFKNNPAIISAPKFQDLIPYLSSGTVRGITLFFEMNRAFRTGATLLIDEIELHLNKQIVADFIGFFQDAQINVTGATLVYSTHYLELIDAATRKDENYILTRQQQTTITRYNEIENLRVEVKKSDIFRSNFIGGTAPNYQLLTALKKNLIAGNSKYQASTIHQ